MSVSFAVVAQSRELKGKGASRRLRRLKNEIPAVVYGAEKPAQSISLITKDLVRQLEDDAFFAHIIDLSIDGTSEKVVLKDIQRHPVSHLPMHADFLRINPGHKLTLKVPLHFINEQECEGVKNGSGTINYLANDIEISCLPKDLPEFVEVDLANIQIGQSVHISEITLPAGSESVALSHGEEHDLALVTVLAPKGASAAEDEAEEASE